MHTSRFSTQKLEKLLHREAFTHSKLLHTASFLTQQALTHSRLLHTAGFYTQQAFTHRKLLHAVTLMQPLQCDLQLSAAKDNSIAQTAARARNFDAAIPTAIRNHAFQNTLRLRTHRRMQSGLKPQLQCGQKKPSERACPQPPPTRATLHRRLQPLYAEKRKVSCSGFLPNTSALLCDVKSHAALHECIVM